MNSVGLSGVGVAMRTCPCFLTLRMMYWTDWGFPAIWRAPMDSGELPTRIVSTDLYYPNGIAIDLATDTIYWVDNDPHTNRIESCDLQGSFRRRFLVNYGVHRYLLMPYSLKISEGQLYFSCVNQDDRFGNGWNSSRIRRMDLPHQSPAQLGRNWTSRSLYETLFTVAVLPFRIYDLTVVDMETPRPGGKQKCVGVLIVLFLKISM